MEHAHEQTCLSAGTIANNNQLATDFRHLRNVSISAKVENELWWSDGVRRQWSRDR